MKNLLVITTHLLRQGPNVQLYYLCKYLDKSKFNIFIAVIDEKRSGVDMTTQFVDSGVKILNLNHNRYNCIFKSGYLLNSIVINNDIDVVYSFAARSNYFASKLNNVMKVTSVRSTLKINAKMVHGNFIGSLFYMVEKHYIKKFNLILAPSETVQNHLNDLGVISNVVRNSIETSTADRKSYKDLEKNRFISVSSKLKGKNIEFLLKAFTNNEYLSKYDLQIAGFVDEKIKLKYTNVSNIFFLGHVKDLENYLLKSDYFISASLHEGLPNAVLESMKVGTPVILSDIPSHKEIIESSKLKFGILFRNNMIESLVESIKIIQKEDYLDLSRNSRSVVKNDYNPKDMANSFAEIIYKNI